MDYPHQNFQSSICATFRYTLNKHAQSETFFISSVHRTVCSVFLEARVRTFFKDKVIK